MLGDETHFSRRRPFAIREEDSFDSAFLRKLLSQLCAGFIFTDQSHEDAGGAERGDVAGNVAGAADIALAALDGNDRCGRLWRDTRHLAINELVEHDIPDAEYDLPGHLL